MNLVHVNDPKILIINLCKFFYNLGWVTGTGGGISIKENDKIFVTPSGVQKEYIDAEDIFVINLNEDILYAPANTRLKLSECTPLFNLAYKLREAGSVIHSHSINAAFLTVLLKGNEFRINKQEMIKGIKKGSTNDRFRYDDLLIVPIIENTPFEKDLTLSLKEAMKNYPETNAVLVRRHGVYIWGKDWIQAKTMSECYHYLFEMGVKLLTAGLNPVTE